MKPPKKTIRLQFTVFPEYADKIKRINTDPFDSDSVYLMKLIDRELAALPAQKPVPETKKPGDSLNLDTVNPEHRAVFEAWNDAD